MNAANGTDEVDIENYTDFELERSMDEKLDENMLDMIIVTYIFVEKLRKDQDGYIQ